MIPILSFVGRSNSGKTTTIESVLRILKSRGYRVGVIKHASHGFELDREGKDSWRFSHAGADAVMLSSATGIATMENIARPPDVDELINRLDGIVDIVLVEGFKDHALPKVVVFRKGNTVDFPVRGQLIGTAMTEESTDGECAVADQDIFRIVSAIEEMAARAGKRPAGREGILVELT